MTYKFKGYDWSELAECWGIKLEEEVVEMGIVNSDEKLVAKYPEKIDVTHYVNGMKMVFEVEDEEEVLAEKIKNHMRNNIKPMTSDFTNKQMRNDLVAFLNKLEEECHSYYAPLYKGIAEIEDDYSLVSAVIANFDLLWT